MGRSPRPHPRLVKWLVTIASLLTVFVIFSVWVERQLLNTDDWVHTSGNLLHNKKVQDALGVYAVTEFYGAVNVSNELQKVLPGDLKKLSGPAASGLQTVAEKGVPAILATSKFQDLWEHANQIAHEKLVAVIEGKSDVIRTSHGGQVTLNLRPLVVDVANSYGIGGIADKIPHSVGQLHILKADEISTAREVANGIRGFALIGSILVLLLFAVAIYLSPGFRWVTLLGIGIGLILAAIGTLILREVAGNVVVRELAATPARGAGDATWSIGTSLWRSIATTVMLFGGAFIVAGWLGSPSKSAAAVRRFLTPVLRDQLLVVGAVFAIVSLVFLLDAVGGTRAVLTRLILIGFAGFGIVYLRRHAITESPEAQMPDVPASLRGGMDSVRGWFSRRAEGRAPRPADPEDRKLERLERLAELRERGALTKKEFDEEKKALLAESGAAAATSPE
jgi:hypothetical protein